MPTTTSPAAQGVCFPVRRGHVVDLPGAARLLDHLLGLRAGLGGCTIVVLTTPVLCVDEHHVTTLAALEVLDARTGPRVVDALERGPLLTGGGALRPEITYRLARRLRAAVRSAPAPHLAAVRGAGLAVIAAGGHPSFAAGSPPGHPMSPKPER